VNRAVVPWGRADWRYLAALLLLAVGLWVPRCRGPLDLRYDAGVYYILGTSLADGRGYRLLNEPGAIEAIQYPPLLPAIGAAAQWVLGTDDPAVVGHWLRLGSVLLYAGYGAAVYLLSRRWLTPGYASVVALLSLIHSHTIFLSDFFAADVPYAFLTTLFFTVAGPAAGLIAIAAYSLRTAGIALLAAWMGESLIRRRFRQALLRGGLAAAAVLAWTSYTGQVKTNLAFSTPAYAYQRAGYQFYNVDYAENLCYLDPFRPELGRVSRTEALHRVLDNLRGMPMTIGEGVSVHRGWWRGEVEKVNQRLSGVQIPAWVADAVMIGLSLPVLAGLVLLARRGEVLLLLYIAGSLFLIAVTPWPVQFVRYLVPLTPFLTLAFMLVLVASTNQARATRSWRWRGLKAVLLGAVALIGAQQLVTLYRSMSKYPSPAVLYDRAGKRHDYRLFFYDRSWQLHDEGLDWLARQAQPGEIVATSTPHWAYLRTSLPAVMPPFEADPGRAATLLDGVPVTYLIVDQLSFLDVGRRYTIPAIARAPDQWRLIYAPNDSGPRIYRRVGSTAK
jgi:hypothetical protein